MQAENWDAAVPGARSAGPGDGRVPRVAVIGGTGSVGRHVCAEFADAGWDVVVIARDPARSNASYRFVALDVATADVDRITEVLAAEHVSVVVNAAGQWSGGVDEWTSAHIHLSRNLVAAVSRLRPKAKVVHLGTVHEYGVQPPGTMVDETIEPTPQTDYARTKFAGSAAVLAAAAAGDIDGVVLRIANVYGPDPAAGSFLGFLAAKLPAVDPDVGIELTIADARRDYIDNRDVASAVVAAAGYPGSGRVFNIGTGTATTLRELVYALVAAAGLPESAVHELESAVNSRGGDWTCVNAARATAELGWRPHRTLADSVRAMVANPTISGT